jgi:2-methylisocitrate lyase-like PEP mutase family enzyme
MADHRARLAALLGGPAVLSVPGVWDGLSLRLVEQAGFPLAFLSGGALSMARLGRPDIGLASLSELVDTVMLLRETSDLPLIVDADTGFGNALNAQRTMRLLEQAGASAIQLEDQLYPKRCGHMAGKAVIPSQEYIGKLKAVLDARRSASTLVIARTDARSVEGFEATMARAHAYHEAGADLLFVEGPQTVEEMQAIATAFPATPLVHNLVEGGVTPVTTASQLQALGYRIALHPLLLLHGFIRQAPALLEALKASGTTDGLRGSIADLPAFNALLGAEDLLAKSKRFGGDN